MIRYLLFLMLSLSLSYPADRPYHCGFYSKNFKELEKNYVRYSRALGCRKGETIASVGAANGYVEVQISCFVDSINWYIQDIDTGCLNQREFNKVLAYHEKLKGGPLNGQFHLVLGDTVRTNLPVNTFDRVLLVNVYHELSDKKALVADIYHILKPGGRLVIMERMAQKAGERNADCGMPKPMESE